tara:strand:- start:733 stop:930 length:198 start_codon:yes stop_codon:yes gene_type:complete
MSESTSREGVLVIDAARLNCMQGVCEAARIWNRSKGEDKMRAERGLIRAIVAYEELQREDAGADH